MRGNYFNDPARGATGELLTKAKPNYAIVIVDGVTRTVTGARAERVLAALEEEDVD